MIAFELQLSRVQRLTLTNFRNYQAQGLSLPSTGQPDNSSAGRGDIVALIGPNGAGKTNVLEALSLLSPGRGLRGSPWADYARKSVAPNAKERTGFSVACEVATGVGPRAVGIGAANASADKRQCRLDGQNVRSAHAFAEFMSFVWLTPQQDGLFRGAAEERRRFVDQLATALDASYASEWSAYQNSARQRLRLLKEAAATGAQADPNWLAALEDSMARHATTVAVARRAMVRQLSALAEKGHAPFPGARLNIDGTAEQALDSRAAVDVEDQLKNMWREERGYDQRYGRTHTGPHRSDFLAWHSEHGMPAQDCSTGEQKAMLIAILLSHAQLIENQRMVRPILLLDEATAHLDPDRRMALLEVLRRFGGQCWLTGTDLGAFPGLGPHGPGTQVFDVHNGLISPSISN